LSRSFKVLVVDDSPVARKLVQQTLPAIEYEVLVAQTGKEALEMFGQHHPAMVITDWMMPDLTGIELCQRIRSEPEGAYTYLILLTSISDKAQVVRALEAGADDYLTKPFHPQELLARVGVGRRTARLHLEIEAKNRVLEQLALTDPLTGLYNRRAIEEWASKQLRGAVRHGFPLWGILADLDYFKSVNDVHGHHAGDSVLRKFADVLKENVRHCDMCARVGGEEFLLILTHVDRQGALIVAERIRKLLATHVFHFSAGQTHVTASFGVAGIPCDQDLSFDALVARADAALYQAKRCGRDRVEVASAEDPAQEKVPSSARRIPD